MEVIYFDSLPSTNSELIAMSKKSAKSWTVIWTKNQTKGKSYNGTDWQCEQNSNLAFSLLIKNNLEANKLVYFNQWVCIVLANYLLNKDLQVAIKWPNDIIVNHKKIAGLLIESQIIGEDRNTIIGIGLNVNQKNFKNLPKASSLVIESGKKHDINEIVSELMSAFQKEYHLIENKSWEYITQTYHKFLYKKDTIAVFKKEGTLFNGIIKKVSESGNLIVELENNSIQHFKHKEIELMF